MNLVRLIYVSQPVRDINLDAVREIHETSNKRNEPAGITGVLYFARNCFMQCLEGPSGAVNAVYNTIIQDPRHKAVCLLSYGDVPCREFSAWSMGFATAKGMQRNTFLKYSSGRKFNPYEMRASTALLFLKELMDTATMVK